MVLRTLRTAFILSGLVILVSTVGNVHTIMRANLTSQGSMLSDVNIEKMSTLQIRQHLSAPERTKRDASAEIALGSMLLLLGLGLHAYIKRRTPDERAVKVHTAPVRRGRETRKMDRWFLWMTVRM
ncbi:hypothetical protein AUJ46_00255 [Candidatus Peregrinibacteria bacterium CG1_02_54_53]|nr:MAG: hypothetical protein AUJ46_00255 [Candidatus Peregrinibacteria bacterium CG1_02_54_53]